MYSDNTPFDTGFIEASHGHRVYYERIGNPKGIPVVFLHGGPGGGIAPKHRTFFNPEKFHVTLFDQRGCGQSEPFASLENNTTWNLIEDIEALREKFGIEKWAVFGGSWGSTLALTYAITHPERASHLILRGIFLCRPHEIQWFYQQGSSRLFPEAWEKFLAPIAENERGDLLSAYHKRLTSENESVRLEAAKAWSIWEASTSQLHFNPKSVEEFGDPQHALPFARIECHYFTNNAFFDSENWILENTDKIQHIPAQIVHGRYDVICPVENAWQLHQRLPNSELTIIPDEGHSAFERQIHQKLTGIMDQL